MLNLHVFILLTQCVLTAHTHAPFKINKVNELKFLAAPPGQRSTEEGKHVGAVRSDFQDAAGNSRPLQCGAHRSAAMCGVAYV